MDADYFNRYLKAWNEHDVDAILDFFTDDGVYEDVAMARVSSGKEELRAFATETFHVFPDFHLVEASAPLVGSDGRYSVEWTMSGTHEGDSSALAATHKKFAIRGASLGELEGGKIKRNSDYWNLADFLVQIGILPPMPTG